MSQCEAIVSLHVSYFCFIHNFIRAFDVAFFWGKETKGELKLNNLIEIRFIYFSA